jgi:hypothetical protein
LELLLLKITRELCLLIFLLLLAEEPVAADKVPVTVVEEPVVIEPRLALQVEIQLLNLW